MSDLCTLDFQDEGAIALVTLNHQPDGNAMSPEMGDEFRAIVEDLRHRSSLRAVILCGANRNFSIGGNREMLAKLSDDSMDAKARHDFMIAYYDRWLTLLDIPVPVIAAFEGKCIGVAVAFAFLCDIAIADETTHYQTSFAAVALFPGMGMAKLLPDALGRSRAGLILTAGVPFSGAEAERLGVVARCVPAGTVHDAAMAIARQIASNGQEIVRELVSTMRIKRKDLEAQLESDANLQAKSYASEEFKKRIVAYLPGHHKPAN